MSEYVRVVNQTSYNIGLKTQNGIAYNIRPHLFVRMNRDDVEYNMALAPKLFAAPAQLVVEDEALNNMMGIDPEDAKHYSEAEIEKVLKGSANKLDAWLEENHEPHILEAMYQISHKIDLPVSKITVLQKHMPNRELLPE